MGEFRMLRLGNQIRDEISLLISKEQVKDPRVSTHLCVNRVEVARDLSYAKVYVSSFLSDAQLKVGVDGLNSASGFIQSSIAKKLTIRKFPKLTFIVDTAMKEGFYMVEKINRLEKQEAEEAELRKAKESENQKDSE